MYLSVKFKCFLFSDESNFAKQDLDRVLDRGKGTDVCMRLHVNYFTQHSTLVTNA